MTHDRKTDADAWVDALLNDVASAPVPKPSQDLMARVLADATAKLPPPGGRAEVASLWHEFVAGIGGWFGVGGVLAAGFTGLVIGLGAIDPSDVDTLFSFGFFENYDSQSGLSAFGWDLEEERL